MRTDHKRGISTSVLCIMAAIALLPSNAMAAATPLVFEKALTVPNVPLGPYSDHLSVDAAGKRVFATPQAAKMVAVLGLEDGKVLKTLPVGNPHAIYYSSELKRLFVADGTAGAIDVFDGNDYSLLKTVAIGKGTDWFVFDPKSDLIYVNNGGEDAGMDHSQVTVVDGAKMEKVGDIAVPAASLEGSALDPNRQVLYVSLNTAGAVAVIDLVKQKTVATWKFSQSGHRAMGLRFDPTRSRLYVTTRDSSLHGSIIAMDTNDGHTVATLPIGGWADDISLDEKRSRIYVTVGIGYVETYSIGAGDAFTRETPVETSLLAKTGTYSSELDRMFVSVPTLGDFGSFQVLVYKAE